MTGIWEQLARQRICFGHQSVGAGLVTALSILNGGRLTLVEGRDPALFQQPVFAHFRVGTNGDPLSKFRDFSAVINGGVGEQIDVAFFKLCYVDVGAQADVKNLFAAYQDTMESLRGRYPKVVFLYVTVPLRRVGGSFLGWLRETTGGVDREQEDQARRHAFNRLLRGVYARSGRLFDLAEEEATLQDGTSSSFRYRGEAVQNLVSDYTDDGGHLNRSAAEHIAGRLAIRLSAVR